MSLKERYEAAFVLSAVGDALGYKNGKWEFCPSGITIHEEVEKLGGVRAIRVDKANWRVSDDTVLHLATAETLIQDGDCKDKNKLYSALARAYQKSMGDMQGRAPGETCMISCAMLEPEKRDGFRIPFSPTGGGCGAAVRSMCIGLRLPDPKDIVSLIEMSIEAGRMTHNHPTGYLGSLASALFASFAIQGKPVKEWGASLLTALIMAKDYVVQSGHDVGENLQEWDYFQTKWEDYLALRNIKDGTSEPIFPETYDVNERDIFYRELSFDGQGGASGHDAPMIAYDALLGSGNDWEELCLRAMFHGGDSDSTGAIAGCLYGALFGFYGIPDGNYKGLEYLSRLRTVACQLLGLVSSRPCDQIGADSLVTDELQQLAVTGSNSVKDSSINNTIEDDCFVVNELLLFAKENYWDGVWEILGKPTRPKKAYLINVIPEARRWGILHQTLYWKNEKALTTLLQFQACDPNIISKQYTTTDGDKTHDSAVEVAKKQGFAAAERILESHTFAKQIQDTYLPEDTDIDRRGISIIAITLAAYKNTFHPQRVDPKLTIFEILKKIYNTMNTTNSWMNIRDVIYDYAFVIDAGQTIGNSQTRQDFYEAFIRVYTNENTRFYDIMNTALRKQKTANYRPSGNDIAIGPFITAFQMIILFWDELPRESGVTYRQVLLSETDLKKYKPGLKFAWHTFVSSAKRHENATNFPTVEASGDYNVMFIIDNSNDSFWKPRDVKEYSTNKETERLYPIGARFKVKSVIEKDIATDIELELL